MEHSRNKIHKKKGILFAIAAFLLGGCTEKKNAQTIWYEQTDNNADLIEIDDKNICITSWNGRVETYPYKTENKDGMLYYVNPEDEFGGFGMYYELYYDAKADILYGRDFPYMDGDGGYHLYTFKKTKFVPTPEPVYGERIDNSDPDALKSIESKDIVSLDAQFYYVDNHNYGDMAPDPMRTDEYIYHLVKTEDGYTLTSNFCEEEIHVEQDLVDQIQQLIEENQLAQINGIDIHTEEMPYDTPAYDISILYASDEKITSSANGKDIPSEWQGFEESFNRLLFDAFVDAGYNPGTNEFHSSAAMKRVGSEIANEMQIEILSDKLTKKFDKAEYELMVSYNQFNTEEIDNETLKNTLNRINTMILDKANETFEKSSADFEAYIKRTKKYSRNDSWMMHGIYLNERYKDTYFYGFFINEFHAYCDDSLGSRINDNTWCVIDMRTGEEICIGDLFNSPEEAYSVLEKRIQEQYGTGSWYDRMDEEVFHDRMMKAITTPASEGGISFFISHDYITIYINQNITGEDWVPFFNLYYDSCQEQLNDEYCTMR